MLFWQLRARMPWSRWVMALVLVGLLGSGALAGDVDEDEDDIEVTEPADNRELQSQASTHKQVATISAASEAGSALKAFGLCPDGKILALVQVGLPRADDDDDDESPSLLSLIFGGKKKPADPPQAVEVPAPGARVRIFDTRGKQVAQWPVDFMAEAMSLGPDGRLYLAGSGRIARYDLEGRQLAVADTPQTARIEQDREALREAAEAQIKEQAEAFDESIQQFSDQRDELAKQDKDKLTAQERQQLATFEQIIAQYKKMQDQQESNVDEVVAGIVSRLKRINALAVNEREIFLTCGQTKGYGYGVWRMNLDFSEPECIITGLSGCCGQMDVCCHGDELWVAENSRHRVVQYNRAGKRLSAFGKRDRDGLGAAFGGCCNPMNLCFDSAGDLLVAESNGQVKHFTPAGNFVGLVGVARVKPGCKNSAVATTPDGDRIYYIDVEKSQIVVLARSEKPSKTVGN